MAKKPQSNSPSPEQVGKILKNLVETGYIDKKTMYKMSFFKGVFAGLGGVIGATIVVAAILWLLSIAQNIPFIGDIAQNAKQTVETIGK